MTEQLVHSLPAAIRRIESATAVAATGWVFPTSMMPQLRIAYRLARRDVSPLAARLCVVPILARHGRRAGGLFSRHPR